MRKKPSKIVSVTVRLEMEDYQRIVDIALLESQSAKKKITANQLMKDAINFVYSDNEKLRECFQRSRECVNKKYMQT